MSNRDLYVNELIDCLRTQVSSDLELLPMQHIDELPGRCYISQLIIGDYAALTAVYAEDDVLLSYATSYAGFEVSEAERDEVIADFLNNTNGRFAVSLSNSQSVECSLSVPEFTPTGSVRLNNDTIGIPVRFPFGTVTFVFSE